MFPSAVPSLDSSAGEIDAAPWDLDPSLLSLLRDIICDAAPDGAGAALVMGAPRVRLRVLASMGGAHLPWRALALSALEQGETVASGSVVATPVHSLAGVRGVLLLQQRPESAVHEVKSLARVHAARVEMALSSAASRLAALQGTAMALFQALTAHDNITARHSVAVGRLARVVGNAMGLAPHALLDLDRVALLHDVGKIAVPLSLLSKPETLTTADWARMREHPAIGARIVGAVPSLESVSAAIRHHHERWDGAGYPDRLSGLAIPLHARIIAVVDAYETMRAGRPYQAPIPPDEALAELRRGAGSQFDPGLFPFVTALSTYDIAV